MAEDRRNRDKDDDLPVYLARPGTTAQVPRQKYGGMFCSVEGAYESKTLDFDALSVGRRSSRSSRSSGQHGSSRDTEASSDTASVASESAGPSDNPGVQITIAGGKERLQNRDDLQMLSDMLSSSSILCV